MAEQKMFYEGEKRYISSGIHASLPVLYQILLWNAIDSLRDSGKELDYLQVFQIQTKDNPDRKGKLLIVTHSQEKPPYSREYVIPVRDDAEDVNGKVYVIDDTENATMLWAEEY